MYPINYSDNPIFVEASKYVKSIAEAERTGDYNTWNEERIRNAFKRGHGTMKDFMRYARDNRPYCNIFEIVTGKLVK